MDKLWKRLYDNSMREVLKSQGARNVWNMMDECNGFLEAITYCIEEDEGDRIGFFPNDTIEDSSLMKSILEHEPDFPTRDCPHYGGVRVGILTSKGAGELEVVHDMNDLFSYSYVQRGVQLDYGRLYRDGMIAYISGIAEVLNSSKALKERKLKKKE
jgi:hypothetical protein